MLKWMMNNWVPLDNWANLQRISNTLEEINRREKDKEREARRAQMTPEQLAAADRVEKIVYRTGCGCYIAVFGFIAAVIIWFIWECFF